MKTSPSRQWDFSSAALFMLAILISVWRLTVTHWTDNLGIVINLSAAAAILGLALGASRFGKRTVFALALGYTLVLIPNQLLIFYPNDIELSERLMSVGGRLLVSLQQFAANQPVKDPIFFITFIGIIYWLIALLCGYQLTRHQHVLASILPPGLALLVIHQFDQGPAERLWIVALYFLTALMLIGRGKYLRDRADWETRRVHLAPETGPDLNVGAFIGAAALILLAWNLPLSLSGAPALERKWQEVTRPMRATRDRFNRAFDALEGHGAAERAESFRSSLGLGRQAARGTALIFKVSVPPEALELPRLYWRARVYDHYENGGWSASPPQTRTFSPVTDALPITDLNTRSKYEFVITSFTQEQAVLNLPAEPVWLSRPADVAAYPLPNGAEDLVFIQTFPFLEPGETYRVRAAIANPSIQELRAAGTDYPAWVLERYLQLPENFSKQIRNYASQITFGLTNPYEKAQTVTTVLRAQITYQPTLTLPPSGTDLMEWFLFESKQGYCNYSATAEVLMLRSIGVPARMAVGYSQGEATQSAQRPGETEITTQDYSVYQKNMHAWPEVYFPGIGWVEFEPTGNQPALVRPATPHAGLAPLPVPPAEAAPEPDSANPVPVPTADSAPSLRWLIPLAWLAALTGLAAAILLANRRYALVPRAAEYMLLVAERRGNGSLPGVRHVALFILADPFERAFHPVNLSLRWLGETPAAHLTPAERIRALNDALPEAAEDATVLLREFHAAQFTSQGGNVTAARRAGWNILRLGALAALRRMQARSRWR